MFVKINNMIRKLSIKLMNKKQYINYLRRGGGTDWAKLRYRQNCCFWNRTLAYKNWR